MADDSGYVLVPAKDLEDLGLNPANYVMQRDIAALRQEVSIMHNELNFIRPAIKAETGFSLIIQVILLFFIALMVGLK